MTLKEMIERVQQHHPEMNITEIVRSLNDATNDMGFKAELIEAADEFETVANQRLYQLKKHIIKVKHVDYDGKSIKKLLGRPKERDLDQ
jgi:predicted SAM-dependent methyltransferase|tara:strand:- start:587 stop:853 length:267 start_codon:yes stop_codon:yes gene_type:complete